MNPKEQIYLNLILDPIRFCNDYKPKFGQGSSSGVTLSEFQRLYKGDPFYRWLGLNNPMMYAAHKAAGGITSLYRQIGIGCEKLFRTIIKDELNLSDEQAKWSYSIPMAGGRSRTLSLDGRIPINEVANESKRDAIHEWMRQSAEIIGVSNNIFKSLTGSVFEVRQGYKSKDSKRQNADIANAATAYASGYLPCAVIFSQQIDEDILLRYRHEKWVVLVGSESTGNPLISTYDFMQDVIGYDLAAFFKRNSRKIKAEVNNVLKTLLTPEK